MTIALLFARTLQDAYDSAVTDWHWQHVGELRSEFRRPDTNEVIRFVLDQPGTLNGLQWKTRVYLGRGWDKRSDAEQIRNAIIPLEDEGQGFFDLGDPLLPPPRPRRSRDDRISELRAAIGRLEQQK